MKFWIAVGGAMLALCGSAQARTETPSGHRDCRGEPINTSLCVRTFTAHRQQRTWFVRDRQSAGIYSELAVPRPHPAPVTHDRFEGDCSIEYMHWRTLRVQIREWCDDPDTMILRYSARRPTRFQFRFMFLEE